MELAQYTCDSCYSKKIKCDKQLPICSHCQQQSNDCTYSRAGIIHRRPKRKRQPVDPAATTAVEQSNANQTHAPVSAASKSTASPSAMTDAVIRRFENQFSTIERSLVSLEATVKSLASTVQTNMGQGDEHELLLPEYDTVKERHSLLVAQQRPGVPPSAPRNQTFLDMQATSRYLPKADSDNDGLALHGLSILWDSFWQDPEFVKLAEPRKNSPLAYFAFPDNNQLADTFTRAMERGKPLLDQPPPEILRQLIEAPWLIEDKAWILLFSGIALTSLSSNETQDIALAQKLRWNLWSALNDARLLLEPRYLNIQALMILAAHVQDFCTPSLCWMLVNTAGRMLQCLGPAPAGLHDNPITRHEALFWSLDCMDKTMALIFGRSPTLLGTDYDNVFVPPASSLRHYSPHSPADQSVNDICRVYGPDHLHHSLLLSRMKYYAWAHLHDGGRSGMNVELLQKTFQGWHKKAMKELVKDIGIEEPFSTSENMAAMRLGIEWLTFQYHWLLMVILRDSGSPQTCLQAARNALSNIQSLVSDANDFYNGIAWELLYCPFTPLLAVLRNILTSDDITQQETDLSLVGNTVEYYRAMAERHKQGKSLLYTVYKIHRIALRRVRENDQGVPRSNYGQGWQNHLPGGSNDNISRPGQTPITPSTTASESHPYPTGDLTPGLQSFHQLNPSETTPNSKLVYDGPPAPSTADAMLFDELGYASDPATSFLSEQQLDNFDWFAWEYWNHSRNTTY